jgi:hypothetical protein
MPSQHSEKWPLSASPNFPGKRSYPRVSWRFSVDNALGQCQLQSFH